MRSTLLIDTDDTTANLMTYVCYEMAHRPELQKRLQAEGKLFNGAHFSSTRIEPIDCMSLVDAMFDSIDESKGLQFNDLKKLTFMQKVINESKRR